MTIEVQYMGFESNKRICKKYGSISEDVTIGGKSFRVRSQGEKRLAQYLELLKIGKHIKDWAFEQTLFEYKSISKKYLMDFDILNNDGTFEYYEFKGAVEKDTIIKLELLFYERPEIQVSMIFEDRRSAAKFARRKVSKQCKAIYLQNTSGKGLTVFDGKTSRKRK